MLYDHLFIVDSKRKSNIHNISEAQINSAS